MKICISLLLFFIMSMFVSAQSNSEFLGDDLMSKMTLDDKIGQLTLFTSGWDIPGPTLNENYKNDVRRGMCGILFKTHGAAYTLELHKIAVEETHLGIPLLFGYDVIQGHKFVYPISLAEDCSWNPELIEKTARLSAKEAAATGLHWTFGQMVDIARDLCWGRIAEGTGDDTYPGSKIAAAKVRVHQGNDLKDSFTYLNNN